MMTREEMLDALRFYDLDESYIDRCVEAMNSVDPQRFDEVCKVYYYDAPSAARQFYGKTIEEIFGEGVSPFISNVAMLAGIKLHRENLAKWQLDEEQLRENMSQIKASFTYELKLGYPGARTDYLDWATRFTRMLIIQVGRLKYEVCDDGHISIHIPRRKGFDIADIKKSIDDSRKKIREMYGLENPPYRCKSWLLSRRIYEIVGKDSNIGRFHDLFNVTDSKDATHDLLKFIWQAGPDATIETLAEDTSLQRAVKADLLAGRQILLGEGTLK